MRACTKCGVFKDEDAYSPRKSVKSGINSICKDCVNEYARNRRATNPKAKVTQKICQARWDAKNPDKLKAIQARYKERHPTAALDAVKRYVARNYEMVRTRNREGMIKWRTTNREMSCQKAKEWRARNKAKCRDMYATKRAAKLHRSVSWRDKEKISAIYAEATALRELGFNVHVDHIIPLQGKNVSGLHVHNNLRIVTAHYNLTKHNKVGYM